MNKISSYEILTKIFIYSQNPEARFLSHHFLEISILNSVRADFLIYKFGKENAFNIQKNKFFQYPKLFQNQELILRLFEKGANPDSKTRQNLFIKSIKNDWDMVVEYFLNLFEQTTERKFNQLVRRRGEITGIKNESASKKETIYLRKFNQLVRRRGEITGIKNESASKKETIYLVPTIDINLRKGKPFNIAFYNKNIKIIKQLLNAHKIIPKIKYDEYNVEILNHPKVFMEQLDSSYLCDILEMEGFELLKSFFINGLNNYSIATIIFAPYIKSRNLFSEFCKRGNLKFVKLFVENGADMEIHDGISLKLAIKYKHLDVVKYLVERGAKTKHCEDLEPFLSTQNIDSEIANFPAKKRLRTSVEDEHNLQEASANGCFDIVKILVENGAGIHENNETALKEASENGHLDIVEYLVENGSDIHVDQDWALGMASKSGHLNVVKYLVEKGANVQAREDFALGIACRNGHLDIVKYLVENGADIKGENHWRQILENKNLHLDVLNYLVERGLDFIERKTFILSVASKEGNFEFVKYLVKNGADIHANDDEALRWASLSGYLDVVKYLLENGADIHGYCDNSLSRASEKGHFEVVKYLVEKGAFIYASSDEALRRACENCHYDIAKYLVQNGADIHVFGNEIVKNTSGKGHFEIVKYLVEIGANIHAVDDYALTWASYNGHLEVVKYLIENGANIHAQNEQALRYVSGKGHLEIAKCLIENGADIHVNNDDSLIRASEKGHLEIVKYLVQRGAEIHVNNDIALIKASQNGHLRVVKYLVENGADIHANDDDALEWASLNGHLEVVKYLIENGADIHSNNDGALGCASEKGHLEIVEYLVENGANVNADQDWALGVASERGHLEVVKHLVDKGADIHARNDYALRSALKKKKMDGTEKNNEYCLTDSTDKVVGYIEEVDVSKDIKQTRNVVLKDLNHNQILFFKIIYQTISKKVEVYSSTGKLIGYSKGVLSQSDLIYSLYNEDGKEFAIAKRGSFSNSPNLSYVISFNDSRKSISKIDTMFNDYTIFFHSFKGHSITFETYLKNNSNIQDKIVYQSENEQTNFAERAVLLACLVSINFEVFH
ncbi:hypothetical protein BB558_002519 [Smittium angustum]|uniref:Uncharacterized protein n=1 Tax=Smittium angustum TaxID=133377 RepID=A0A2U1J8V0_SMIAN|nr:hypothetical protein BB558_002519 [Smittium angustum]